MSESAKDNGARERDDPLRRIVRNSALNVLGTALIVPLNFVALFTMARRLGAESMGLFFTLFAICAVIHWIADAGTTTVLTRRVARAPQGLRGIVGEALGVLAIVATSSVTMFALVAGGWMAITRGEVPWMVIAAAGSAMALRHALDFAANIFRGLERFEFENLARVVQTATFCLFIWFFVSAENGGVLGALWAYAFSNLAAALLIWAAYFANHGFVTPRVGPRLVRAWYGESLPLGVGDVIRHLLLQLDTLLLAAIQPAAMVGLFAVAARPLQPLQLVPRMITSVTFPMMSRAGQMDVGAVSRAFAQTTNLMWVASLPICIAIVACADPLILATVGPEFAGAAGPLRLLIWATVFVFINAQLRFVLTAMDQERRFLQLIAVALVCKLALGVALIASLGVYGACLANLLGEAVLCFCGLGVLYRLGVSGPGWTQLLRAVPAAAAMAALLAPFAGGDADSAWVLAAVIPVSALVYAGICLATGAAPWAAVSRVIDKLISRSSAAAPSLPPGPVAAAPLAGRGSAESEQAEGTMGTFRLS